MLTDEQIEARIIHLSDQELAGPEGWWWLSFVDADESNEQRFLGVAIVRAHGLTTAIAKSRELGINPGGAVMCVQIEKEPPKESVNRLLSESEALAVFP